MSLLPPAMPSLGRAFPPAAAGQNVAQASEISGRPIRLARDGQRNAWLRSAKSRRSIRPGSIFSREPRRWRQDWLSGGLLHKHHQQTVVPVGPPVVAGPAVAQPPPTKPPCMPPVEAIPVVPIGHRLWLFRRIRCRLSFRSCRPFAVRSRSRMPARPQGGGAICPTAASAYAGPELLVTPGRLVAPVNIGSHYSGRYSQPRRILCHPPAARMDAGTRWCWPDRGGGPREPAQRVVCAS